MSMSSTTKSASSGLKLGQVRVEEDSEGDGVPDELKQTLMEFREIFKIISDDAMVVNHD